MKKALHGCVAFGAMMLAANIAEARVLTDADVEAMLQEWAAGGAVSYDGLNTDGDVSRIENVVTEYAFGFDNPDNGERLEFALRVELPWMEVSADAETENRINYTVAEDFTVRMMFPEEAAEELGADGVGYDVHVEGFAGWYEDGDGMNQFSATADVMEVSFGGMPAMPGMPEMTSVTRATGVSYTGEYADGMDLSDPATINLRFDQSMDGQEMTMSMEDGRNSMNVQGVYGAADGSFALENGMASATSSVDGVSFMMESSDMPFPLSIAMESMRMDMGMPLVGSEDPVDMGMDLDMVGVTIDEALWGMVDPGGALDHRINRLRVAMDLNGVWRINILGFDPAAIEAMVRSGVQPIEPGVVNVEDVRLEAFGAALVATGAVDVSGATLGGGLNVTLAEWRPLLETLVDMGLVPPQQATMAQSMLEGMAVEGPDGESVFDISFDGGMLNVNNNPVAPLPPLR